MNVPRNRDEAASRSTRSSKKDHGMVMKEEERERKKKRRREKKKLSFVWSVGDFNKQGGRREKGMR